MREIEIPPETIDLAAKTWWATLTKRAWDEGFPTDAVKDETRATVRAMLVALAEEEMIHIETWLPPKGPFTNG